MYDIEKIREVVKETCAKAKCPIKIPININSRLSTTLGRVMYYGSKPDRMEFSKSFIETATDEAVRQVILHECAHYIADVRTGTRHGHDSYFKQVCAELGCDNDKTTYDAERIVSKDKTYKYAIYCPHCGLIGGYSRWTRTLENLDNCYCSKCGNDNLTYVTNW